MVLGQEVQEPTLLAMVLTVTGFALLLAVCVVAIAGLPAFGYLWWTFAGIAAILGWLVLGQRRKRQPGSTPPTGRQRSVVSVNGRDGCSSPSWRAGSG